MSLSRNSSAELKNQKALKLLTLGNRSVDVAAAAKVHINTVTKIKKLSGI